MRQKNIVNKKMLHTINYDEHFTYLGTSFLIQKDSNYINDAVISCMKIFLRNL